jgi:hypothetical protein
MPVPVAAEQPFIPEIILGDGALDLVPAAADAGAD